MDLQKGRWTAELDGDFVVFLIGAMVHDPAAAPEASALLMAMADMLDELEADPSKGLLGYTRHGEPGHGVLVQYWRSFDDLEAFARDQDDPHLAAWRNYWKRVGKDDRTGIWHETFLVRDGEYEAIYGNMPARGLGKAGKLVPVSEASTARGRVRRAVASG